MLANPTFLLRESHNYSPEDLEAMHHAFMRACLEHPDTSETEAKRECLAKAMVSIYQRHLTQTQLVAAALHAIRKSRLM